MTPDRDLTRILKSASPALRRIIDLADEQGWSYRPKGEGLLFYPHASVARPGMASVYAADPGSESHKQRHLETRMRQAGMKFPEDHPPTRGHSPMTKPTGGLVPKSAETPAAPAATTTDHIAAIRAKLNLGINLFAEVEQDLALIAVDHQKFAQLSALLNSMRAP